MKRLIMIIAATIVAVSYAKSRHDRDFLARRAAVESARRASSQTQSPERGGQNGVTSNSPQPATAEVNSTPVAAKPTNISEITDDKEFMAELNKVGKIEGFAIIKRISRVKDQKLLAEFIRIHPDQANELAETSSVDFKVKDPTLAAAIIENLQNPHLPSFATHQFFPCAQLLSSETRAKYLSKAQKNREDAVKNGTLVLGKFYIGMPVIDYVMLSIEDGQSWTKNDDAYDVMDNWLRNRVDMKADISGKDWKTAWKVKDLAFDPKSRYKYFKVKGTADGLLEFAKKYLDKAASHKDITINNNWWQFTDEEHELVVYLNDESGFLNIKSL